MGARFSGADQLPFPERGLLFGSFGGTALGQADQPRQEMVAVGEESNNLEKVLINIADIMIDVFSAESAVLRAAAQTDRTPRGALHADAARVFVNDAAMRVDASARQALAAMTQGDTLRTMLAALRRLAKFVPIDTVTLRRRLADEAIVRGGYIFA